jgi:hypothetical protein
MQPDLNSLLTSKVVYHSIRDISQNGVWNCNCTDCEKARNAGLEVSFKPKEIQNDLLQTPF